MKSEAHPKSRAGSIADLLSLDLPSFTSKRLPASEFDLLAALHSPKIQGVVHFVLGPTGTNIEMAAKQWTGRLNLGSKTRYAFAATPEAALEQAQSVPANVIGIFWTCAVYFREAELFFSNLSVLPFAFVQAAALDSMQLAARPDVLEPAVELGYLPSEWKIAAHLSPRHLTRTLANGIVPANSNAAAAEMCASGATELSITTESAARRTGLVSVHVFGSPRMIFFGGVTEAGADLLIDAAPRGISYENAGQN